MSAAAFFSMATYEIHSYSIVPQHTKAETKKKDKSVKRPVNNQQWG